MNLILDLQLVQESAEGIPEAAQFERVMRGVGLTDQYVVCASQGLFTSAARAWFVAHVTAL